MANELDEILQKLESIEERIAGIENNSEIISEDRVEVAGEGELENEIIEERNNTSITRKRIPVCDYCGKQLKSFSICQKCSKKLCEKCSINYKNQVICKQDLQSRFPVSREGFKILLLVSNNISRVDHMQFLSGIPKKDIKDLVQYLKGAGFIEASIFGTKLLTEMGREAFGCYCQIFGGAQDMEEIDERIERYVRG